MLYACECWPLKQTDLDRLLRNERAMCEVLRNDLKLSSLRVEDAENRALWRSKTKTMQRHTCELSGTVTLMNSE